jgi:hypothetical protein
MEKVIGTDLVKNEDVLHAVRKERNIVHTIKKGKANSIGRILHE